jgi:hypothetical protein
VTRLAPLFVAVLVLVACGGDGGPPEGFIDRDAAQREAEEAQQATPLPPGASWDPLIIEEDAVWQAGEFRDRVEYQARCKWYDYWTDAHAAGDEEAVATATAMFRTMGTWESATVGADASFRRLITRIEDQAELGDPSGIAEFVRLNC